MPWRALTVTVMVGIVVLGAASPALAKGPDQATLSGPGLAKPIVVTGLGEPGSGNQLAQLAEGSGLFRAMFGSGSGILMAESPATQLGPKYTLAYRVPTGEVSSPIVEQDLYPQADGGPLTYTRAGQPIFPGTSTVAGWFRAPASFADLLVSLHVPGVRAGDAVSTGSRPAAGATPAASAELGAPAGQAAPPTTVRRSSVLLLGLGAAIVFVLLLAGALMRRRSTVTQH